MRCWGLPEDLTADAELVACELVTNAVRHARLRNAREPGHCRMSLERPAPDAVLIGVSDRSVIRPAKCAPDENDTGGRGLMLVESLAADWGVIRRPVGKTVWALLKT